MKHRIRFHPTLRLWPANRGFITFQSPRKAQYLRATRALLLYRFSSRQPGILEGEA